MSAPTPASSVPSIDQILANSVNMSPEQLAATLQTSITNPTNPYFPESDDDAIVADLQIGNDGSISFPAEAPKESEPVTEPVQPVEELEQVEEIPEPLPEEDLLPDGDPFADLDSEYMEISAQVETAIEKVRELQKGDGTGIAEFTEEVDEAVEERRNVISQAEQAFVETQKQSLAIVEANFPEFNDENNPATLMLEAAVAENPEKYGASPTAIAKKAVEIAERLNLLPKHERPVLAPAKPISQVAATPVAKPTTPIQPKVAAPVPPTSPLPSSSQSSHSVSIAPPQGGQATDLVSQLRQAQNDPAAYQRLIDSQLGANVRPTMTIS